MKLLKRPLVTEKNATLQPTGKYVFEVGERANKMQIKKRRGRSIQGNSHRSKYNYNP